MKRTEGEGAGRLAQASLGKFAFSRSLMSCTQVKEISENPLSAQSIQLDEEKGQAQMETTILEKSIVKICSLLAVGFGDAGAGRVIWRILDVLC